MVVSIPAHDGTTGYWQVKKHINNWYITIHVQLSNYVCSCMVQRLAGPAVANLVQAKNLIKNPAVRPWHTKH